MYSNKIPSKTALSLDAQQSIRYPPIKYISVKL